ncbi:MAG: polyprenyl synthetase family protein [Pseudobutyrivibrio sp.]|nr:polyprenyl synthetase family protein [Pseudobutyrivibrio sp.]
MSDIKSELTHKAEALEEIIYSYLPQVQGMQSTIFDAMDYSVKAGGKRLRPILMSETYRMFGGQDDVINPFLAAIEMIHTYSLVHDDLPAMDNDMLRRGKPTTHAKYGEAMAILAGDGLLNFAFETASTAFDKADVNLKHVARAFRTLSTKAGVYGMIGGQVVDVESEKTGQEITEEKLDFIYDLKTGALIEASMTIGAILAGACDAEIKEVEEVAKNIGLAFQIQDDILDIEGDEATLGKPIGSDEKNQKATYVSFAGMENSKKEVKKLTDQAVEKLHSLGRDDEFLTELMNYLVYRNN